jgi:very-short-patch-repair endonuclease
VVALAGAQEGVVSRRQLHGLGIRDNWIDRRVAMGWLVRVFHGVYAVGHLPRTRRGWHVAALLAGGERSVLSHTSAASVHLMIGAPGQLHLSVPRSAHGIEGIRIHRPRTLRPDDIVIVNGLRVTSPARTLIDLADFRKRRLLEQAIDQAEYHRLQVQLSGRRRDFLFREQRVVVEIDGRDAHDRDGAFERDALRDAEVVVNGHRPLRFTRRAAKFDPTYVELALRAVLTGAY